MRNEADVKRAVKRILDELGAYYAMPVGGPYGRSGVPDFLVCFKGAFIAIETKFGSNKPTALQTHEMNKIGAAGGRVFVINEDNVGTLSAQLVAIFKRRAA